MIGWEKKPDIRVTEGTFAQYLMLGVYLNVEMKEENLNKNNLKNKCHLKNYD